MSYEKHYYDWIRELARASRYAESAKARREAKQTLAALKAHKLMSPAPPLMHVRGEVIGDVQEA